MSVTIGRAALCLGLALGLPACATDGESLLVIVFDDSEGTLVIPADLDAFEIRVASAHPTDRSREEVVRYRRTFRLAYDGARGDGVVSLPQTLRVVEADDELATGLVRVDVLGLRNGRVRQRITRYRGFGDDRLFDFGLSPVCFLECPPDQSCRFGVCGPATPECGMDPRCEEPPPSGLCGFERVECLGECVDSSDSSCGSCGHACAPGERCIHNICACGEGFAFCDGVCVDLANDVTHCGACGIVCSSPTATTVCAEGGCDVVACNAGRGNCNAADADACEVDLGTDIAHCGACNTPCAPPNAAGSCVGGACEIATCAFGWEDCNGLATDGCETSLPADVADCDGNRANGCETILGTDAHCAGCAPCRASSYCYERTCVPLPSVRMILSGGDCGDEAISGVAWTMEVRGRPFASAHVVADGVCPDRPIGPMWDFPLGAAGFYSMSGTGTAGAMTTCMGEGPLVGRWTVTADVDGHVASTGALFSSSLCPAYDSCSEVTAACP